MHVYSERLIALWLWPRRAFRRWLFRRMFPDYKLHAITARPSDGQQVVVLDVDASPPVWIAEYDAHNESYSAGGGWFEAHEIDYYSPMRSVHPPIAVKHKDLK